MKKITVTLASTCALTLSAVGAAFAGPTDVPVVPEPGTFALLGIGAVGLVVYKKFKK